MISESIPEELGWELEAFDKAFQEDSLDEISKWRMYESFKNNLRERCLPPEQYEIELSRILDLLEL